ncbi:MAG TPA: hypothetical protein VGI39_27445 [Polyangiaceae bacterium]|jgi:hypothetical protein
MKFLRFFRKGRGSSRKMKVASSVAPDVQNDPESMPPAAAAQTLRNSSFPPPPSRPSSPPTEGVRTVLLPDGVRALDVADRAREALLALLRGVGNGWGKREVARWLVGPYHEVTAYAAVQEDPEDSTTFRRVPRRVATEALDDVLRGAKEELLATLILAAPPDSDVRFSQRAILAGHVVRTRDAKGRGGWTAVDAPRMRLSDRVVSLAAVDYLMRPADYLALLSVCGVCQAVSFDAQDRVRGQCTRCTQPNKRDSASRRAARESSHGKAAKPVENRPTTR